MAAWALGEIEDSAAVRTLTPLLADPDAEVRTVAAWALGQIESGSALPALEKAKDDSSPSVRRAVQLGDRGRSTTTAAEPGWIRRPRHGRIVGAVVRA